MHAFESAASKLEPATHVSSLFWVVPGQLLFLAESGFAINSETE